MRRTMTAILVLGLLAAGCAVASPEETTTTVPLWALDPRAPAGNASDGDGRNWDSVVEGETWRGWSWRVTAGGPIDVGYLDGEGCAGGASRAPAVECLLPEDGGRWVFSFAVDVPVTGWGEEGEVPQGAVLIVRGPDGAFACSGEYRDWQYFPGPAVEIPSVKAGTYDVWVAAPEGASLGGELVIAAPAESFPTTTTTLSPDEPPATPASTVPPPTG
jgi:hypothetical protein